MSADNKHSTDSVLPHSDLPALKTFITTHDADGKAIASVTPASWTTFSERQVAFDVVYTTSEFPPDMNNDKDIKAHESIMASGKLGLVNAKGTVCRIVDFGPGHSAMMHRTQSLDYGVVLEGSVEMRLDSGEVHVMNRGDVAVQRATAHAWKNRSTTSWARMLFVLQDSQPLMVNGKHYGEDLSQGDGTIPASGNDAA